MKKFSVLGFIVGIFFFAVVSCSEDSHDYLEKAAEAMANENSEQALEYYQKAYLLALDDDFFPLGIKRDFQHLETNLDKDYIVLTSFDDDVSRFWFFNDKEKIIKKGKIDGEVKQLSVAPAGTYTLFSVSAKKKDKTEMCALHLFSLEDKSMEKIADDISCNDLPAVNNDGLAVFVKEKTLYMYNAQTQQLSEKNELSLKFGIDSIVPKTSLFFSTSGRLFLTYGQAGMYNAYALKGDRLVLLSDKVAFWRVLFFANEPNFALVEGGAGKRSLVFFDELTGAEIKTKPVEGTTDFSFVTFEHYYVIEKQQLKVHLGGETNSLPFFASTVRVDKQGQVYLLTLDAKFIKYGTTAPSKEVMEIFKRVQEFYN